MIDLLINLGKKLEKLNNYSSSNKAIHQTDVAVLIAIYKSEIPYKLTPSRLLESVLITSGAMTASLNRLVANNLITRELDKKDGRINYACLTELGIKIAKEALNINKANEINLMQDFDELEKRQFRILIKKLSEQLV